MTPVSTPTMPPEVLVVVGTRPEAIKLLPVIVALRESSAMTPVVVSTGQHRRLVAEVLALGHVGIDIDLPYPEHPLGLTDVFTSVMSAFEAALTAPVTATGHEAAARTVQGDTPTAAAAPRRAQPAAHRPHRRAPPRTDRGGGAKSPRRRHRRREHPRHREHGHRCPAVRHDHRPRR